MNIQNWKQLISLALSLGYENEQDIKDVLRRKFGKGGGATRDYEIWYKHLCLVMKYRKTDDCLAEWDIIWNESSAKLQPMRLGTVEEMKEHIERYRNEQKEI